MPSGKRVWFRKSGQYPPHDSLTAGLRACRTDRKSTRLNSSHEWISYAVFCLKKKKKKQKNTLIKNKKTTRKKRYMQETITKCKEYTNTIMERSLHYAMIETYVVRANATDLTM